MQAHQAEPLARPILHPDIGADDGLRPSREPVTLSIPEAAKLLGISKTLCYEAALRGEIPSITIGTRRLVPRAALERLLQSA